MIAGSMIFRRDWQLLCKIDKKHFGSLVACLLLLLLTFGEASAATKWPHIAFSKDGTPISYEIFGAGEPTLVFVHGWSCDARYWRAQVPVFSKKIGLLFLILRGMAIQGCLGQSIPWALSERMSGQ